MINHIETEQKILAFTIALTGISEADIKSATRNKHMVRARAIYAHIMRLHGFSSVEVGSYLDRDHTTILALGKHYVRHNYGAEIGEKIKAAFPELSPESTGLTVISS